MFEPVFFEDLDLLTYQQYVGNDSKRWRKIKARIGSGTDPRKDLGSPKNFFTTQIGTITILFS